MIGFIENWIRRMNVRTRQKRLALERKTAMRLMNLEQKEIFDLVVSVAKKEPECIRYDKQDRETILRQENLLITISKDDKDCLVSIDNHKGFHKQWFHEVTWEYLNRLVDVEAHRYRRKLKSETRSNIRKFIQGIKRELE